MLCLWSCINQYQNQFLQSLVELVSAELDIEIDLKSRAVLRERTLISN